MSGIGVGGTSREPSGGNGYVVIKYIADTSYQTSSVRGSDIAFHFPTPFYPSSSLILADTLTSCVGYIYRVHLFLALIFNSSVNNLRACPDPSASSAPLFVSVNSGSTKSEERGINYEEILTKRPSVPPTTYPTSHPTINYPEEESMDDLIDEDGDKLFDRTQLALFIIGCCIFIVAICRFIIVFVVPKWKRVRPSLPFAQGEAIGVLKIWDSFYHDSALSVISLQGKEIQFVKLEECIWMHLLNRKKCIFGRGGYLEQSVF